MRALLSLLTVLSISAAQDSLMVVGKVLGYDPGKGILKVDVESGACRGVQEFTYTKGINPSILVNKRAMIFLDSSHCKKGSKVVQIIVEGGR